MKKIILYFANSDSGGGLVRLSHYLPHLDEPNYHYLVSTKAHLTEQPKQAEIIAKNPKYFQRLFNENYLIEPHTSENDIVFSHGAPITPKCRALILHINNALPFVINQVNSTTKLRLTMTLLLHRLHQSAKQARYITVESEATQQLIKESWGKEFAQKCLILSNGVDRSWDSRISPPKETNYALSIGTYPYKRIDLVIKEFEKLRLTESGLKLILVGTVEHKDLKWNEYIQQTSQLPYLETRSLMAHCNYYISLSQIENCSISLLEAIHHKRKILCSAIPSHIEFLTKHGYDLVHHGTHLLMAQPKLSIEPCVPDWHMIAEQTKELLGSL